MELSQVLALAIFVAMFAAIIVGKVHRFIPALVGAALTIMVVFLIVLRDPLGAFNVLNVAELGQLSFWFPGREHIASHGVNWQTIVFIGGMMTMVDSMGETGFFSWLCLLVARLVKYRIVPILIAFMLLSGFLAMFIDSITVLLFMAAISIELARLLKFDPVPFVIAITFAANTGGSATISGDPPNIIIGTALGFTFTDFITNTGPIAWAGMLLALGFFYLILRKSLTQAQSNASVNQYPKPREAITNPSLFKINTAIFILVILLLVTHAQSGLSVALVGVIAAFLTLLAAHRRALHIVKRIDWRTLLFFLGLFVAVGGLEANAVLEALAESIGSISNGSIVLVMTIILWISAFASSIVDNIPFAATMVPVIANLSQSAGVPLPPLAWALALGTDIGGNATPIGASANVVATAIAAREGHPISWVRYMRYALPATVIVLLACWVWLSVRY